jgi:glycosyltransferase involved in cell wall biosynthesis
MVIPNETGLLAPGGDVAALTANIDYFVSLSDTSSYSINARKIAEERCSENSVIKQLVRLYENNS